MPTFKLVSDFTFDAESFPHACRMVANHFALLADVWDGTVDDMDDDPRALKLFGSVSLKKDDGKD